MLDLAANVACSVRRGVQPVHVVDEAQHPAALGDLRKQAEHGATDRERVGGHRRRESEGRPQRLALHVGNRVQLVEHRVEKLEQPGERELGLGLDPARAEHAQRAPRARSTRSGLACLSA